MMGCRELGGTGRNEGGKAGGGGQIAGGPISALMASKLQMREYEGTLPRKAGDPEEQGPDHTHRAHTHTKTNADTHTCSQAKTKMDGHA